MAKPPIKPREVKRATDAKPERVASRIITARVKRKWCGTWHSSGESEGE